MLTCTAASPGLADLVGSLASFLLASTLAFLPGPDISALGLEPPARQEEGGRTMNKDAQV